MVLLGAQCVLEVPPPRVEDLLSRRLEAQEGQFLGRQLLRAKRRRLQGGQPLEDLVHARPRLRVRPPVHVPPPPPAVGPHRQLEALEQPVIPAPGKDLAQVALEWARLDPAQHGETGGSNVQRPPPDPIVGVRPRAVPGFAVKRPVVFMPPPVHRV